MVEEILLSGGRRARLAARARLTAVSAGALMALGCATSPRDAIRDLSSADPKYHSPECVQARTAAMSYDEKHAEKMLVGAGAAIFLGPFGLPLAAAADIMDAQDREAFLAELRRRCVTDGATAVKGPAVVAAGNTTCPVVDAAATDYVDYQWGGPTALVNARSTVFEIGVHPSRPTLMVKPGQGQWRAAADGMTHQAWIDVASGFVAPAGCSIVQLAPIAAPTVWEASYQCAEGTDLRQLMIRQRSEIERGGALRAEG